MTPCVCCVECAAERSEAAIAAMKARRELQERVESLKGDFDEEQKATFEITANMTRQYKAMQEQLLNEINKLETTIDELKDKLGASQCRACPSECVLRGDTPTCCATQPTPG